MSEDELTNKDIEQLEDLKILTERRIRLLRIANEIKEPFNQRRLQREYFLRYPEDDVKESTLYRDIKILEDAGFLLNGSGSKYVEKAYKLNREKIKNLKVVSYELFMLTDILSDVEDLLIALGASMIVVFALLRNVYLVQLLLCVFSGMTFVYMYLSYTTISKGYEIDTYINKIIGFFKNCIKHSHKLFLKLKSVLSYLKHW